MQENGTVLTAEEAANLLRVSLPCRKVARSWRFLRVDVLAHVHGTSQVAT